MRYIFDRLLEIPAKRKWLLLVGLVCLVLAAIYVIDVWLLGTVAAAISALAVWIKNPFGGQPDYSIAMWFFQHPFSIARTWLGPDSNFTNPEIRKVWLGVNAFVVLMVIGGLVANRLRGTSRSSSNEHRDIRKLRFRKVSYDIHRYLTKTPLNQYFLGLDDQRRPVSIPASDLFEHLHILGGSGSGKTAFGVTPICIQAIKRDAAVIVIDFKGDRQAIQLLRREAVANGKKFYFFTLDPGVATNTYNPLATGTPLGKVERIMTALELVFQGEAKFYSYVQQATFIPLIRELDNQGVKYTLADIYGILMNPGLVFQLTSQKVDENQIKGLTAALTPYTDLKQINAVQPDIDLAKIMQNGDVVYFDLRSALAPEASSAIGKMIAQDLQYQAAFRMPQSRPAIIAIDEFQNMACQAFRNVISKVRSANYGLLLANQAMGDLQAVGDDFVNTIQVNTRTKIVFNADNPADADFFAKYTGTALETVTNKSENKTQNQSLFTDWGDKRHTVGESISEIEVPLIHPNIFIKLPPGKSVIIRRGKLATLTNHAFLISKAEKDRLEQMPLPKPERMESRKEQAFTVGDMLANAKKSLVKQTGSQDQDNSGMINTGNAEAQEVTL